MARGGRYLAGAVAIALFAFFGGFVIFASSIAHYAPVDGLRADAIVVLTGGEHRLSEAAKLLSEDRGKRLLISGVNRATTHADIYRMSGPEPGAVQVLRRCRLCRPRHHRQRRGDAGMGERTPLLAS